MKSYRRSLSLVLTLSLFFYVPLGAWVLVFGSRHIAPVVLVYIIKIKIHSSCEIEYLSKLIFASCVWYSVRAYYGLWVLIKDIGRRLPLQLQCSYQGQQGDVRQSVRGNYQTRFWGGQNLTAVEGNASVYQVNPVIWNVVICMIYVW